jgi:hypothetical protein
VNSADNLNCPKVVVADYDFHEAFRGRVDLTSVNVGDELTRGIMISRNSPFMSNLAATHSISLIGEIAMDKLLEMAASINPDILITVKIDISKHLKTYTFYTLVSLSL